VELNPNGSVAQYRLGAQYLNMQKPHDAVEHLQKAYQIDPQDQSTLNALQTVLRQDHQPEAANKVKQQLAELLRKKDEINQNLLSAVRLNNEGAELEKAGNYRGALEKYRDAVRLNPDHIGIRVNYGVALLRTGQWTEGLNQGHEAVLKEPDNTKFQAILKDALAQAPSNLVPDWNDQWSLKAHPQANH
jgi:tetratricopeptide (TPR) repeat protein